MGAASFAGSCNGWAVGRFIDDLGSFTTLTWRLAGTQTSSVGPVASNGVQPGPVANRLSGGGRGTTEADRSVAVIWISDPRPVPWRQDLRSKVQS